MDRAVLIDRHKDIEGLSLDEELSALARLSGLDRLTRWLVDFAQTDLTGLTTGRWTDLSAELVVFSTYGPITSQPRSIPIWRSSGDISLPTRKIASDLQAQSKAILEQLLDEGYISYIPHGITHHIRKLPDHVDSWTTAKNLPTGFLYNVNQTLSTQARHIRRCAEDKRIFYADRRTQKYCSISCQNRALQRRFVSKGGRNQK